MAVTTFKSTRAVGFVAKLGDNRVDFVAVLKAADLTSYTAADRYYRVYSIDNVSVIVIVAVLFLNVS